MVYYYKCCECKKFMTTLTNKENEMCPHCGYIYMRKCSSGTAILGGHINPVKKILG